MAKCCYQVAVVHPGTRQSKAMLDLSLRSCVIAAAGVMVVAGCTFYTSCPTGNGSPSTSAGGSSSNVGGSNVGPQIGGEGPEGDWVNVTPDLSALMPQCGPVYYLAANPTSSQVVASVANSGLWATDDGGETWRELGKGEGSLAIEDRIGSIVFEPSDPKVFWGAGAYGAGAFWTLDGGETFQALGTVQNLLAISVDFTDPFRATLLATGYDDQHVYKSDDGGEKWQEITDTLPDETKHCRYPLVIDANTFLLGCGGSYGAGKAKILRSTDAGQSWEQVYDDGGGAEPLYASDGSIYWSKEFQNGLVRSTDLGETWQEVAPANLLLPVRPAELADGSIASLTTTLVVATADAGKTWQKVSPALPFEPLGFAHSTTANAFFSFELACEDALASAQSEGIQRFDAP